MIICSKKIKEVIDLILKQIFIVNFDKEVKEAINKKDGVYSIIYFLYYMIMIFLFGLFLFRTQVYKDLGSYFGNNTFFRFLFYIPYTVINILPIFLILKFRKQSLTSVGIKKTSYLNQFS